MALPIVTRRGRAKISFAEATIDLASIDSGALNVANDVTVPGAEAGDTVVVNWTNEAAALGISAYVSAQNTVTVVAVNSTSGAVNAASATFYFAVIHRN